MKELNYQIKMAQLIGLVNHAPKKWRNCLKFIQVLHIFNACFFLATAGVYLVKNYSRLIDFVEAIGPLLTVMLAVSKFIVLLMHSKEIFDLIDGVKELNIKCEFISFLSAFKSISGVGILDSNFIQFLIFQDLHLDQQGGIDKANKLDRLAFKLLVGPAIFCGIGYVCQALVKSIFSYFQLNQPFAYEVPFKLETFYELENSMSYIITYIQQSSVVLFVACSMVSLNWNLTIFHRLTNSFFFTVHNRYFILRTCDESVCSF